MGTPMGWNRLLWKEFREGWIVLLVAAVAPAILFPMAGSLYHLQSYLWFLFGLPGLVGVHIMIVLWAAGRGGGRQEQSKFAFGHLPVSPLAETFVSLVVPLIAVAALGLWFGYWTTNITEMPVRTACLLGALDLAATYSISYFISAVVSSWAAFLFGSIRVVTGTLLPVWDPRAAIQTDVVQFVAGTTVGTLIGSLLFAGLSRKKTLAFRQAIALLAMLVITFAPAAKGIIQDSKWIWRVEAPSQAGRGFVDRSAMMVDVVTADRGGYVRYEANSARRNLVARRSFKEDVQLLDAHDIDGIYLAQQSPGSEKLRVLKWNAVSGKVATVAVLPVRVNALLDDDSHARHSVSSDGRYLMVNLRSLLGNGSDYWFVDLKRGTGSVVLACDRLYWILGVTWLKDRALMYGYSGAVEVDLRTMRAHRLKIPKVGDD